MPLVYSFKVGSYAAIAGASFSPPRQDVILLMDDYVNNHLNKEDITSKEIESHLENNYRKNPNDYRSLVSLMKKCSFLSFDNCAIVKGSSFYTTEGYVFVRLLRLLRMDLPDTVRVHILKAYHLLLQKAIVRMINKKVDGSDNLLILLKVISLTRTLSLNEYLYALSEKCTNPHFSINAIAAFILRNREDGASYSYISSATNKPIADSAMQMSRELLQQAGVFKTGQTFCELLSDDFLIKNKIV